MPGTARPASPASSAVVVIAVDGGARLGYGHVGRCLAIWEELSGDVAFSASDPQIQAYLAARGAPVSDEPPGRAGASVVVLDRATPAGSDELSALRSAGQRVALIDDPGPGRAVADLVVDPPTGADWAPAAGRRLWGFEHVLLRREIRAARPEPASQAEVLVSLGGSDPTGLTPDVLAALARAGIKAKAVLGPAYAGAAIEPTLRVPSSAWPSALAGAGLLVTRFGHTLLEAAHLGIPAIGLAVSDRDRDDGRAFAAHGTARILEVTDTAAIVTLVAELLADQSARTAMARAGSSLVDGQGAARVAAALLELAA